MGRKLEVLAALLLLLVVTVPSSQQQWRQNNRGQIRARPFSNRQLHEIHETIRLVSEGEAAMNGNANLTETRDFVLVIGNTGAGKSTITKLLTQPGELESYDAGDRFLIRDINQTNQGRQSTIVSQTLIPELFIDTKTKTAFYDMPGFSDTRNASVEIAKSWLMKRVMERAGREKILFIVNYSSLRRGESRHDFKNLIDFATNFIQNPIKIVRSIALIATKVDVVEDPKLIHDTIRDFLEETLESLEEVFQDPDKVERAIMILNMFLMEGETGLSRVAYFKQPRTPAPLTSFPDLMDMRGGMWRIINKLRWSTVAEKDFGVSLSPNAELLVQRSEQWINSRISTAISDLTQTVGDFFQVQISQSPPSLVGSFLRIQEFFRNSTSSLKLAPTRSDFLQKLGNITDPFGIPNATIIYQEIERREGNLQFLKKIGGSVPDYPLSDWSRILTTTEDTISRSICNLVLRFNTQMEEKLNTTSSILQAEILYQVNQSRSENETAEIFQEYSQVLDSALPVLGASRTYNALVYNLRELGSATSIRVPFKNMLHDIPLGAPNGPFSLLRWLRPLESLNQLLKTEVTEANTSLRQLLNNQTLEGLQQTQAQMLQEFGEGIDAFRQETSELQENATREKEEIKLRMVEILSQLELNATLEQELLQQQLLELEKTREDFGNIFNETLKTQNKTMAAQQALLAQRVEALQELIQREKEEQEGKRRTAEEKLRKGQEQLDELNTRMRDLRAEEEREEGHEFDRNLKSTFFSQLFNTMYPVPKMDLFP